jgi:hypothetical protein
MKIQLFISVYLPLFGHFDIKLKDATARLTPIVTYASRDGKYRTERNTKHGPGTTALLHLYYIGRCRCRKGTAIAGKVPFVKRMIINQEVSRDIAAWQYL